MNEHELAGAITSALSYTEETGLIIWKNPAAPQVHIRGKVAGYLKKDGYRWIKFYGKLYSCHRVAWLLHSGEWPKYNIDHINGDKSDNRISNLRDVTQSVNQQNKIKANSNNKTGILGVSKRLNRFYSNIWSDGKNIPLGVYDDAESAGRAYLIAKRILHEGCTI